MNKKSVVKISIITLVGLIVLVMGIMFIISGSLKDDKDRIYKHNSVRDFGNTTHKFTGKSEHYIFKYGLAYIKDKEEDENRKINISGFEQIKRIDGLVSEKLKIYATVNFLGVSHNWNDELIFETITKDKLNRLDKEIENFIFYESGKYCLDSSDCEGSLIMVSPDEFNNSFKIAIEYCTKDECKEEFMEIDFK